MENKVSESLATEILENFMYLGDLYDAGATNELLGLGVTHILNVQTEPPELRPQFETKHIPLSDLGSTILSEGILDECFQFIEGAKEKNGKVLLHCVSGINRSATITIAYLIHSEGMDLTTAFEHVQSRRRKISPHSRYIEQLIQLEKEKRGSTPFYEGKLGFSFVRSISNVKKKSND